MLNKVTMTGADDSIDPVDLIELSQEFPFVEWGILLSESQVGTPRFPSEEWLRDFAQFQNTTKLNLCAHLCGKWVREVCAGRWTWAFEAMGLGLSPKLFDRIQLNFHAYEHLLSEAFYPAAKYQSEYFNVQLIFQCDGTNDHLASAAYDEGINAVPLYDESGGAGIVPSKWPGNLAGIYSGYAGGLGPDNLKTEIPKIAEAASSEPYWIDMETKVRSDGDRLFDLAKVRECLEIAALFITQRKEVAGE